MLCANKNDKTTRRLSVWPKVVSTQQIRYVLLTSPALGIIHPCPRIKGCLDDLQGYLGTGRKRQLKIPTPEWTGNAIRITAGVLVCMYVALPLTQQSCTRWP